MEKGFDTASMNDVYAATGVSKSTLYSYFKDKQELFVALIDVEREKHASVVWATLDEGLDVGSALARFGERIASISAQEWVVRANRTVLSVADRMPDLARNFYENGRARGERRFAEYLDARVADGSLVAGDTLLAAQQFFALCQAAFMRARLFGALATEPSPREIRRVVASAVEVFLAAYGVGPKS
jgi:TetR/AcrR family transcriptional regulator of autoinduction and epiphytic fitness